MISRSSGCGPTATTSSCSTPAAVMRTVLVLVRGCCRGPTQRACGYGLPLHDSDPRTGALAPSVPAPLPPAPSPKRRGGAEALSPPLLAGEGGGVLPPAGVTDRWH